MAFAVAVFLAAPAVIATQRIDRTKVALLGATLLLLAQTLDQSARSRRSTSTRSGCSCG
jgi:Na+/H+ antiporter NhaD/arsenite permease-like protein